MQSFFATRRFLPLFVTQFLGASNDNLFKNALTLLVVYRLAAHDDALAAALINWIAALFILPFLLFSATAGSLADSMDKARIARATKLLEMLLVAAAAVALWSGNVFLLLAVMFGFGTQSAFFGPVKYALLPQHLRKDELVAANGYVEAATFLAILLGTIIGGAVILREQGIAAVIALMAVVAAVGYGASRRIPPAPPNPQAAEAVGSWNPWTQTRAILRHSRRQKGIFPCILAITWFWVTGVVALAQLPALVKQFLHANEYVTVFFLILFSVGIGIGSLLCRRILHDHVRADIAPLGAMGMGIGLGVVYFAVPAAIAPEIVGGAHLSLGAFLQQAHAPWMMLGFLVASICGGIYVVPLYALMQHRAAPAHRARIIASNNILNAAGMAGASILVVVLLRVGLAIPHILLLLGIGSLGMAWFCLRLASAPPAIWLMEGLERWRRVVVVRGTENIPRQGGAVLVANHISSLDAPLLANRLPRRGDLVFVEDGTEDTAALRGHLGQGKLCVIFPEGVLSATPHAGYALRKMRGDALLLAESAGVPLIPVCIDGTQFSLLARSSGVARRRLLPEISVTILPPQPPPSLTAVGERERGQQAAQLLYRLMSEAMFAAGGKPASLPAELLAARRRYGGGAVVLKDQEGRMTYRALIAKSLVLGRLLRRALPAEQKRVGLMLPNVTGAAVCFFALQYLGYVAAMMNFSAGPAQVTSACRAARVRVVLTSRRFVEMAQLQPLAEALQAEGIELLWLEDLRGDLRLGDKLAGLWAMLFPETLAGEALRRDPGEEAVTLFTSGSEGAPKGVALSHANITANLRQVALLVDFGPRDTIFNCLPLFHAFGLTAGLMLPLRYGAPVFLYPSPLHYAAIPEAIYRSGASILFSADTFLRAYARAAHQYDFHALRLVFAGAEKLREETSLLWSERFGVRVLQGYGVTETAPVAGVNTPMENRPDTVGRALPGVELRLEAEEGLRAGQRLYIRGPNVMLGYLRADAPGEIQPPPGGWHDTGDIATLDADGYLSIVDRYGRFAKIGGEMVSLGAVEAAVGKLWEDKNHVVTAVSDAGEGGGGECLVLLTQQEDADLQVLGEHFRALGLARLWIPRRVFFVAEMPLLPTGKTDYVKARALAREMVAGAG